MTLQARYCEAAERLREARRVAITTHTRPDGDAIGSSVGLGRVLREQGGDATVHLLDAVPPRYQFLTDGFPCRPIGSASDALADVDLICIVDTSSWSQLEPIRKTLERSSGPIVVIDHHRTRDAIGHVTVLDESAGATAEMITTLCRYANWPISADAALALLTGLATDTGWFRFSNATPRVFETAAYLLQRGVPLPELYERLYLGDPAPRLRLMGRLLASMELLADGRIAVLKLPQHVLHECGATSAMTEELINEPQRIGSVNLVILCAESDAGVIRVSLRSKRDVDVAALAARYGGGGHERAAGARISGRLDDVAARVVADVLATVGQTGP
ncbi:MAG: bifunctional oligoribonuclease/PAP phosphatase NrnA [Phycisphaerae bacterium]|nr:bifunctional oligoribonuclease/PAP phosphatase NrnA [Phycisphaerae bacterium]